MIRERASVLRYTYIVLLNLAMGGREWSASRFGLFIRNESQRFRLNRGLGGPHRRSCRLGQKNNFFASMWIRIPDRPVCSISHRKS